MKLPFLHQLAIPLPSRKQTNQPSNLLIPITCSVLSFLLLANAHCGNRAEERWARMSQSGADALDRGDQATATEIALRQLKFARTEFGDNDLKVAMSLQNLGICLQSSGNLAEAESLYTEAIGIYELHPGELEHQLALTLFRLGKLSLDLAKPYQAETVLTRCVEIRVRLMGESDPLVGIALIDLARALVEQGRAGEALLLLNQAYAIHTLHPGVGKTNLISTLEVYGKAYRQLEMLDEAEENYEKAIDTWRKTGTDSPYEIAILFFELGIIREQAGQLEEAVQLYREAVEAHERRRNTQPRIGVALHLALANGQSGLGNFRSADSILEMTTSVYAPYLRENPKEWSVVTYRKAVVLSKQGRMAEAEISLLKSVELARKGYETASPIIADKLHELSRFYHKTGQPEKAQQRAMEAVAIAEANIDDLGSEISNYFDWAASLLREAGRFDEAAQLEARADSIMSDHDLQEPTK